MNRRAMSYLKHALTALFLPMLLLGCNGEPAATSERPPLEGAKIGGPFTLVGKDGKTVHWADFAGKYRIVYFGYTFCPDACPLDLQTLMRGFATFEKAHPALATKVQPIFITIDPERDTPEIIGQYTAAFHPRLMGLTGTPEQVAAAANAFAVYYSRGEETAGGYLMDHSRFAFLMGPDGKPITTLPVEKKPMKEATDAVSAELEKWVR